MAACATCGSTILFGGREIGSLRFCNDKCAASSTIASYVSRISDSEALIFASRIHSGKCPACNGDGPVDVRTSHQVWSALLFTRWKSTPRISCRPCGVKAQASDMAISAVAGWWGLPWGLIMTPVQLVRNAAGMAIAPDPQRPSDALKKHAKRILAEQLASAPETPSRF